MADDTRNPETPQTTERKGSDAAADTDLPPKEAGTKEAEQVKGGIYQKVVMD
jgi:hypothetical protein